MLHSNTTAKLVHKMVTLQMTKGHFDGDGDGGDDGMVMIMLRCDIDNDNDDDDDDDDEMWLISSDGNNQSYNYKLLNILSPDNLYYIYICIYNIYIYIYIYIYIIYDIHI